MKHSSFAILFFLMNNFILFSQDTIVEETEWMAVPKDTLPIKNRMLLNFCDSMYGYRVGKGICRNLIQEALEYSGYVGYSSDKDKKGLKKLVDSNFVLITGYCTCDSIFLKFRNDSVMKLDSISAFKYISINVLPGDIIWFSYEQKKFLRKKWISHIGIIKQIYPDGTMSVYEQNYYDENMERMKKEVALNPYSIYDNENFYFIRPD